MKKKNINFHNNFEVDSIDGFCMLINKKKLQSILKRDNLFDEKFFMYLENDDLCKRVRDKNEKIFIIPSSKIRHYGAKGVSEIFYKEIELSRNWHWSWSKFYFTKKFKNFKNNRNLTFHSKRGVYASKENCELFVSVATFIYFSEIELIRFIDLIKINKSFKALIMHEIFLNEKISQSNKALTDKDINIHSISMIKKRFGKNYDVEVRRTFYPNWEKEDRISAILYIKKI